MDILSLGTCENPYVENTIGSYFAPSDDIIAAVLAVLDFSISQTKFVLINIDYPDLVSTGVCINGEREDTLFNPVMEHELGHFTGLGHLLFGHPDYPSDTTLMGEFYRCTPTELTPQDLAQIDSMYPISEIIIPDWIKIVAGYWASDQIPDSSFLNGIGWLIEQGIIQLGEINPGDSSGETIPAWIKNLAGWWASGLIDNESFANALKYLIEHGIIQLQPSIVQNAHVEYLSQSKIENFATLDSKFSSSNFFECNPDCTFVNDNEIIDATYITPQQGSRFPGCEQTQDGCFDPSYVTINLGDSIVMSNTDHVPHTFTSGTISNGPDGYFDTGLFMSGSSLAYTPDTIGEYPYFCMVHPWMTGKINVVETVSEKLYCGKPELSYDKVIKGTKNNDILKGSKANDLILGFAGNDVLRGYEGNDCIIGGAGNDRLMGNQGKDTLIGGSGDDWIRGGWGNDILRGNAGTDTLIGAGNKDKCFDTDSDTTRKSCEIQ